MTIDHDAIAARVRQNREAGTPGPWKCGKNNPARVSREGRYIADFDPLHSNAPKCEVDAHRAAHLPDLEAAYLDLYDEVKRLRADMDQGALDYCDLMTRHDAHFVAWQSAKSRAEKAEAERDALRAVLAPAMDACKILDEAVKAGHETTSDLILHLLSAVEPARQALKGQPND